MGFTSIKRAKEQAIAEGLVNLSAIWVAAGRPESRRPGRWRFMLIAAPYKNQMVSIRGAKTDATWATAEVAEAYRSHLEKAERRKAGHVYFVFCESAQRVKIGIASDLERRTKAIATQSPVEVRLLGAITGNQATETKIHRKFNHLKHHGEWFDMTPELARYINFALNCEVIAITAARLGDGFHFKISDHPRRGKIIDVTRHHALAN